MICSGTGTAVVGHRPLSGDVSAEASRVRVTPR